MTKYHNPEKPGKTFDTKKEALAKVVETPKAKVKVEPKKTEAPKVVKKAD